MTELTIKGISFPIRHYVGTIIHLNVLQDTHTSTTGGGGRIGPDLFGNTRGKIEPIKTHASTRITQEVHYRDSNGKEDYFRLDNRNLPFREGQEIELVYVFDKKFGRLFFLCIYNLQKKIRIEPDYQSITNSIYSAKYSFLHWMISLLAGIGLACLSYLEQSPLTGLFLFFVGVYGVKKSLSTIQRMVIERQVSKKMALVWENL